jgi:phosphate-selective porin OprO/OprP
MWYRPELNLHDNNGADFQDGRYGASGRLTALPIYQNEGRQLLHLGVSGTWREADKPDGAPQGGIAGGDVVRFRARPGLRDAIGDFGTSPLPGNSVRWVDTGVFFADGAAVLGTEFFSVLGPLSLQAEYAWTFVPNSSAVAGGPGTDLTFSGGYAQVSYFLTGENRVYDRRLGRLGSTYIASPFTNFWSVATGDGPICWGLGAWEIAARYNYLDLNDGFIRGGRLEELNVGVNWYLNPNWKIQFEYIHDRRYDLRPGLIPGDMDGLGIRTQFYF